MSTIIGIIIVIVSVVYSILIVFSCTDTYKNMVIQHMKEEYSAKLKESIPDKIIINIKYESDDGEDDDKKE